MSGIQILALIIGWGAAGALFLMIWPRFLRAARGETEEQENERRKIEDDAQIQWLKEHREKRESKSE